MEISQAAMGNSGLDSKRFGAALVVCLFALPGLFVVYETSQNQKLTITWSPIEARNDTEPSLGSRNDSTQHTNMAKYEMANGTEKNHSQNDCNSARNISSDPSILLNETSLESDTHQAPVQSTQDLHNTSGSINDTTGSENMATDDKLLNGSSSKYDFTPTTMIPQGQPDASNHSSSPPSEDDEKFFYGLFPPGIEEDSCLSRYQSFLYHRSSYYKPSSHLQSKLRKYEKLHRACGPNTKSYRNALNKLKSNQVNQTSKCNYIVWMPANGLGNRMVSMVSSFLYALLTNRILLVDFGRDMRDLFCEPFPKSSWLLPSHFPLKREFGNDKVRHSHSVGSLMKKAANAGMETIPPYLFLNLNHGGDDEDRIFYCDKTQDHLQNIPWLLLLSDQYFVPSFFLLPSFEEEVKKLFPEKETVFYHLGHYIFNPSNHIWGLITRFYEAYLAGADQRIGLQVRVFNPKSTPRQTVLDQILACGKKEELLPQIDTQISAARPTQNGTSKAILVTSLYPEFYENIKNMYWTNPTLTGEAVGVYQPSHEAYQHFGDNMHNMKAWAEIYLLSLSNVLVTSAWSTFGYVAQGLGGLKPWFLYKTNDQHIPDPPCGRDISREPCFHFPLTFDCNSKAKVDAGTLVPYIRHCQDLPWGVKLVSNHDKL
ncbi:hypothetical protein K2173_024658 [Erythroxylum novogranatense]|uniref:Fucosyltransferase n=1 Tax=Erythroxylum novogranatense TaxID=1862640 RepID=A0AAV8SUW9_9ROSI|nr:hypothetical protein K2173_024658 [Erythroxylum novogranatense]